MHPLHNELELRYLSKSVIKAYDSLVSADSSHLRQDARKERNDYVMGNNDTLQEYLCKFEGLLWNRNSKHEANQATPIREAVKKLINCRSICCLL